MSTDPFLAMRLSVFSGKFSGPQFGAVSLGEIEAKKKARACGESRGQRTEVRSQKSEVRGQGIRGQRSEVRGQGLEVRNRRLSAKKIAASKSAISVL
jgi:hypothetical protein